MATRSVIARATGDSWAGVYCHNDGQPTGVGPRLWRLVHDFHGDLPGVMTFLVDGARESGWNWVPATRNERDAATADEALPAEFHWREDMGGVGNVEDMRALATDGAAWAAWAYVVNERTGKLFVHVARLDEHNRTVWRLVRASDDDLAIDLRRDEDEPDWRAIEARGEALAQ